MKINFLKKFKVTLYALSLAEIFIFGYLADKTGSNTKFAVITAILLLLNLIVYKSTAKYYKKQDKENGF
ncbi:MAG: hypothetical protein LBL00_06570 [Endomicrobium sp.]|jgi:phosphatidylglycerophosphate synthase|nr:hypothetical protein [Endomicrobium sp.]